MASVAETRAASQAGVRLRCWGDFALIDAKSGADLKPRGRKARALLAYLALHPGRAVSRERLAGLLWGDRAEEQARASLRQAIVEVKPLTNGARNLLKIERDHVILDPCALTTDIGEMAAAAERSDFTALLGALPDPHERLFADLEGLDDGFDDWLTIERTRQRDALLSLVADASATALTNGQTRVARALHARLRELDPDTQPQGADVPETAIPASPAPQIRPPDQPSLPSRRRWRIAALAVLPLALAGVAAGVWRDRAPAAPNAIAVLPFQSVSDGAGDFADGMSDEVTAQLARQPGLRVAGRTATAQFRGGAADLGDAGRALGVAYVVEGRVRTAGERVRVNVALVQASNGMQLWSETFDGTLDDIFAVQARIGANVAARLQQRLARGGASKAQGASGAVHTAYLTARALIRERNLRAMLLAKEQLDRALALDPNFAPAWSSLAQAKLWYGVLPGRTGEQVRAEALKDARRALALAPDLAEAHGVLGIVLGYDQPEGQRHIRRAAALDPNNPELLYWLSAVHASEADFPKMLAAQRRAFALDPLWLNSHQYSAQSGWRMGERRAALDHVRRVEREGSRYDAHMARGFLAAYSGDLSRGIAEFGAARAATSDVGKQARAAYARMSLFFNLGYLAEARHEYLTCRVAWFKEQKQPLDLPEGHKAHLVLARDLPAPAALALVGRRSDPVGHVLALESVKRLINADRAAEAVALYDNDAGLLGLSARRSLPISVATTLRAAPVVAAALIAVGREAEAIRLLQHSNRLIAGALRRSNGRAPAEFYAEAAQTWALLGKRDAALAALDRAHRNGWINAEFDVGDLVNDIGDEPAFASLRLDSRFQAIRARMNADLKRERREVIASKA